MRQVFRWATACSTAARTLSITTLAAPCCSVPATTSFCCIKSDRRVPEVGLLPRHHRPSSRISGLRKVGGRHPPSSPHYGSAHVSGGVGRANGRGPAV